ncbi:glycosyltransferase [Hymenobacter sp. M29]|uniref:Glycosyltransferase n=1 Tax=Hymenobacter mellowenesis TaxID=3063995 RepID=A0ABT9A7C8_9BACT|nr:glycosyltransferase [Hymenobacter sp. M29]MDO7845753.1 glycosyltransferase [Hymenobacter sp. M29]
MFGSGSSQVRVLLASVLKPVDDTRMRGKFAETLRERPNVQVHIAGRAAANVQPPSPAAAKGQVGQHPIFQGSRLSLGRLVAQWRYWQLLQKLRPALVIVHAPELLPLTLLWQRLGTGRKFIYDIRENYALNVRTQRVYGGLARRVLAGGLRWVETLAAQNGSAIILAEASYADELPYLRPQPAGRVLVLENKYQPTPNESFAPHSLPAPGQPLRLLYSGTISELNGVWDAIALARQLRPAWPGGVQLTIIGFCQQPDLLRRLQEAVAQHADWLKLTGGADMVPHAKIVAEIGLSDIGLLPYRPHTSTERCRPTKLFEYLAHGLPILASPNPRWQALIRQHGAGLPVDFAQPLDGPALVAELRRNNFYPNGIPADALWASEGKKLWLLLDSLV